MNLNKVILVGRLTQNPEIRTTPSGQTICNFGLATNRVWIDRETNQKQEKTEFHNIVLWRRLADIASQYLKKGDLVLIEGRIETRSWQDTTGSKKYRTEIIAENIQLGPKNTNSAKLSPQKPPLREQNEKEDIPIIEENNSLPPENVPITETHIKEEKEEEEIDVKDIPF